MTKWVVLGWLGVCLIGLRFMYSWTHNRRDPRKEAPPPPEPEPIPTPQRRRSDKRPRLVSVNTKRAGKDER